MGDHALAPWPRRTWLPSRHFLAFVLQIWEMKCSGSRWGHRRNCGWVGGGAGHPGGPPGPSSTSPPSVCKLLGSVRCPSLPGSLRPSEEARPERPARGPAQILGQRALGSVGVQGSAGRPRSSGGPSPAPAKAQVGSGPSRVVGVPGFHEASRTESASAHALSSPGTIHRASATPSLLGPQQRGRHCLWGACCLSWGAMQPKAGHSLTLPGNLGGCEHPPSLPLPSSLPPMWTQEQPVDAVSPGERDACGVPCIGFCLC